jgi:hypothetical protein
MLEPLLVLLLQEAVRAHYDANISDFSSCPSVNYVNLVDPFKVQLQVSWTYSFGRKYQLGICRSKQ